MTCCTHACPFDKLASELRKPSRVLAHRLALALSDALAPGVQVEAVAVDLATALQEWLGPAWSGMPVEEADLGGHMGDLIKDKEQP